MTDYSEKLMERERKRYLGIILGSYANTLAEQDVVKAMINNPETTTKDFVYALTDGLKYGNWPWNRYGGTLEQAIKNTLHKSNEGEKYIPSGHIDPLTGEKV